MTMAATHGTRSRYLAGCRCDDCKDAQRRYQQRYRERKADNPPQLQPMAVAQLPLPDRGPVESGVAEEIDGLASDARPGLAQAALALARVLDNPRAVSQHPAAAKVLAALLEKLRSASARGRRGNLALVRTLIEKGAPITSPSKMT
jgi:hypothetical protein